jgi:ABC-type glutathione transport system ATPase component
LTDTTPPRLVARGLRKGWGDGPPAVDGVDLDAEAGECIGLVGESGSGKTTFAKLLMHILPPDAGSVHFDGVDLAALSKRSLRALRSRMQLSFQQASASLNPGMTIGALLRETVRLHRPGEDAAMRVEAALDRVGLAGRGGSRPDALSGGERRRAALLRALLPDPALLVVDEPTAGLDASLRAGVLSMLRDTAASRTTIVISHELDSIRFLSNRVLVMCRGRIVEEMAPEALDAASTGPRHPYTERLLAAALDHGRPPIRPARREGRAACSYFADCHRVPGNDDRRCRELRPELTGLPGRRIACHHPDPGAPR